MNLYQIEEEIMNCIDRETGEVIDVDALDRLEMERDAKIENIALWVKNLRADAEAIKNEKNALAERQKAAENKAESLKRYLTNFLAGNKFSTAKVNISFRNSKSVEITDATILPETFLRYKEPEPDKKAIKEKIDSGVQIPGASLVEKQSIQIK